MIIVLGGVWYRVSAVIGICGTNFCTLFGDTRRTVNDGLKYSFVDDETHKVLKINDNTLYGMTGLYDAKNETITSAIDGIPNLATATPRDVLDNVLAYLERYKHKIPKLRNYIIGGKDSSGRFVMYDVHMNFETFQPVVTSRTPRLNTESFGISCLFPEGVFEDTPKYTKMVSDALLSSKTHGEMMQKISSVIGEIADVDDTVSHTIEAVSVF